MFSPLQTLQNAVARIHYASAKETLENTGGAIKNGQSRETGNIGYTRRGKTKRKHNTICIRHFYAQTTQIT